jgi:hypothetical protein
VYNERNQRSLYNPGHLNPIGSGQSKATLDIIKSAWSLISMSIEIGNLISEKEDGDIHHKLDELESAINNTKKSMTIQFSNSKGFLSEEIFYNYIRGLIDEVNSCLMEYEHLKANLHDPGMKANFWNQCKYNYSSESPWQNPFGCNSQEGTYLNGASHR